MLCLATLMLTATAAHAGSYVISFSGGTFVGDDGNTYNDYDDGQGDCFTSNPDYYSPYGVYSASGAITVTCTWQPDPGETMTSDPPPQNVELDETGYAHWEASGHDFDGGTCDDGLGDQPVQTDTDIASVDSGSPQLNNDHFSAHTGGASFSFTRSPSITPGTEGGNYGSIIYSVSVSTINLRVDLGGVQTQNGQQLALTGQQITANLIDPATGKPYPAQSYSWSTSGGSPFENWDGTMIPQLTPLSATDKAAHPFTFYDAGRDDTVTVSCTASYRLPDGTLGTVTVVSLPVTFEKPTAMWPIATGYVQSGRVTGTDPSGATTDYVYAQFLPVPDGGWQNGMTWHGVTITLPSAFLSSGGTGCWGQLWTPERTQSTNASGSNPQPAGDGNIQNGVEGLDNTFPYLSANPNSTFSVNSEGLLGDSPGIVVESGVSGGYQNISANDSMDTWLMYSPLGGIYVPLQHYQWSWSATLLFSTISNDWYLADSSPDASDDPQYMAYDTSSYPSWTIMQHNTP